MSNAMKKPLELAAPQMEKAKASAATPTAFRGPAVSGAAAPSAPMKNVAKEFFRLKQAEIKITDLAAPELQPRAELFKELVESAQPAVRLGLISRCAIPGCDVHFVDETQNIVDHVRADQVLPEPFQSARKLAVTMPSTYVAVVVYSNKTEGLLPNGTSVPYP